MTGGVRWGGVFGNCAGARGTGVCARVCAWAWVGLVDSAGPAAAFPGNAQPAPCLAHQNKPPHPFSAPTWLPWPLLLFLSLDPHTRTQTHPLPTHANSLSQTQTQIHLSLTVHTPAQPHTKTNTTTLNHPLHPHPPPPTRPHPGCGPSPTPTATTCWPSTTTSRRRWWRGWARWNRTARRATPPWSASGCAPRWRWWASRVGGFGGMVGGWAGAWVEGGWDVWCGGE